MRCVCAVLMVGGREAVVMQTTGEKLRTHDHRRRSKDKGQFANEQPAVLLASAQRDRGRAAGGGPEGDNRRIDSAIGRTGDIRKRAPPTTRPRCSAGCPDEQASN